jgi:heavy metal sensor kinase
MRLTLWYALALSLALLVYATFVYALLERLLSVDLNNQLERDVQVAERMLEFDEGRVAWDEDEPEPRANMPHLEVFTQNGKLLFRSSNFMEAHEPDFRFFTRTGQIEDLAPVTIRVARPLAPMNHTLGFFMFVLALGIPLAVALASAGGYVLARRALAPLGRMATQARAITAERLADRLSVMNLGDELGHLATVFNDLFTRLEQSFDQLRRFTADASHELRTPLTIIRSVGEVGLDLHRSEPEYREIIGSMLEEADRLTRLVDSLLTLSRADGGQAHLRREQVNLCVLAGEVVTQLSVLAEEKKQSLALEVLPEVWLDGDPLVLRLALINLVDNAIKYSPERASVRVVVSVNDDHAVLEVVDEGPGIAPEHQRQIFDRFYRVDKSRSRQMGGVGLGLAITRWAVEIHGGSITVENAREQGSVFRVMLPLSTKGGKRLRVY